MLANPIASTWWRLFRRDGLLPLMVLTGLISVAAVGGGVLAQLNDRPPDDIVSALLACQMLLLLGLAPVMAGKTLMRAALDGTLASDCHSPLRPRQLLLGYLNGPVAAGLIGAAPGLIATGALALMFADQAHAGWFLSQALAATTGAMLAAVVTVALLSAQRYLSAMVWCVVVLLYLLVLSVESQTSVGVLVWLVGMVELALQSTTLGYTTAEILGLTWAGQLVVMTCVAAAGVRTLDPRRDGRARRVPWLVMVLSLWGVQALAHEAFDIDVAGYVQLALEMLPLALLLLLSARADDAARVDAARQGRLALSDSLVPTAVAMSACFALGIGVTPFTSGPASNPMSMTVASASLLLTLALLADTASILDRKGRRVLGAVVLIAMTAPLVYGEMMDSAAVTSLSLLGAFSLGGSSVFFDLGYRAEQSMIAWVLGSAVLRQAALKRARRAQLKST